MSTEKGDVAVAGQCLAEVHQENGTVGSCVVRRGRAESANEVCHSACLPVRARLGVADKGVGDTQSLRKDEHCGLCFVAGEMEKELRGRGNVFAQQQEVAHGVAGVQ